MLHRSLQVYAFSLPFSGLWLELFGAETIFKPYRLIGILVLFALALRILSGSRGLRLDGYDKGFLFIFAWGLAMAVLWNLYDGSGFLSWALHDTVLTGSSFLIYLAIKWQQRGLANAAPLLDAFSLGTLVSASGYALVYGGLTTGRFSAYYENPNRLGVAVAVSMLWLISGLLLGRLRRRRRRIFSYLLRGAALFLLAIFLFFTGSRSAVGSVIIGVIAFSIPLTLAKGRRGGSLIRLGAVLPIFLITAIYLTGAFERYDESAAINRYQYDLEKSTANRTDITRSAWNVAADHYFLGVGTAQYRYYHGTYIRNLDHLRDPRMAEHEHLSAHSDYLSLLSSNGAIALMVYLAILFSMCMRLMRLIRIYDGPHFGTLASYQPLILCLAANGVTHVMFASPEFWLVMALVGVSVAKQARRQSRGTARRATSSLMTGELIP